MEEFMNHLKALVSLMGFSDAVFEESTDHRLISIIISDSFLTPERIPNLVLNLNRVSRLIAKRLGVAPFVVDVNNYRKERENLIIELARAAARKAVITKEPVSLPIMNAYERRLVHTELATRPDVKTESIGEGKNRYVVVKIIE
jgi:spoIIIJ-associated protein